MAIQDNSTLFHKLRKQYPTFTYHAYHYNLEEDKLIISFDFSIGETITFRPTTVIPRHVAFQDFFENKSLSSLENIIFQIGMIELISYWKCTCSPKVFIKAGHLDENAIKWWQKIYYHGLGEFFYCNHIRTSFDKFVEIVSESDKQHELENFTLNNEFLVPIGGGKDSVVSLELLKAQKQDITPLIINPRGASLSCVEIGGYSDVYIPIYRSIDKNLLDLNAKNFLNGHTPFSAMLAFYSVLIALLSQKKHIALSNESSANEATIKGSDINHQYSKSFDFEADFRQYVNTYINKDVNYFSYLRPLNEMQIALLFSQFSDYFPVFKSCNVGSKTDSWCCRCPKCLFTFIILSPFVQPKVLENIFGENLFNNTFLIPILKELIGETEVKPFECVGTREEVCVTLCEAVKQYTNLPPLLSYFKTTSLYEIYNTYSIRNLLEHYENQHFLSKSEFDFIKNTISTYINTYNFR